MVKIKGRMTVCDCCFMWFENHDNSSCRDYYDHDHKTATVPDEFEGMSIVGDCCGGGDEACRESSRGFTCEACDEWQMPFSRMHEMVALG